MVLLAMPAAAQDALCTHGYASLESKFDTGVTVVVGPAKSGDFSERSCAASLQWDRQHLAVASDVAEIDVDLLGADLGLNLPVAAFQIRKSDQDRFATYAVYSLQKPPHLLRTVSGAENYTAGDVELDGRVAIWTDDASAFDGIDGLPRSAFATVPTIVLRFEAGKLVDAGSEFRPYFDRQIQSLRVALDPEDVRAFKESNGAPDDSRDARNQVSKVKLYVLGLVWSFLYSGREPDAWSTLAEYWPGSDVDRIRKEITARMAKGIRSQVDGVSSEVPPAGTLKKVAVYDQTGNGWKDGSGINFVSAGVDKIPRGLCLRRPELEPGSQAVQQTREWLNLVIDSAGKVRFAEMVSPEKDDALLSASKEWKFIPAFRGGRPVACRFRTFVSPYR